MHPNSKVVFKDFYIPFYSECIIEAKKLHSYLYNIHSIGWDIAITENGPLFIEANDAWDLSLMQAGDRGLKKDISRLFANHS